MPNVHLVFFGDSIYVGQGISIHKSWVCRISKQIDDKFNASKKYTPVTVINASANGRTTREALERMPYEVQSHGVDFLLVQFGLNDCNYWLTDRGLPRVSPNAFKANLLEICERAVTFGAKKIILNTNHPTLRRDIMIKHKDITFEESNRHYNSLIREAADEFGDPVDLNDIEALFQGLIRSGKIHLQDLLLQDKLHLSEKGHDVYYESTWPKIQKNLEELVDMANA